MGFYKSDLHMFYCRKTGRIIRIQHFKPRTNDNIFHIFDQIHVSRVLLWIGHYHGLLKLCLQPLQDKISRFIVLLRDSERSILICSFILLVHNLDRWVQSKFSGTSPLNLFSPSTEHRRRTHSYSEVQRCLTCGEFKQKFKDFYFQGSIS